LSMTASTTGVFVSDANPMLTGTSANFLYNTGTGVLGFDSDGTGLNPAVMIAALDGCHLSTLNNSQSPNPGWQ